MPSQLGESLSASANQQLPPLDAARVLHQVGGEGARKSATKGSRERPFACMHSAQQMQLDGSKLMPALALALWMLMQALGELETLKRQIKQPFMAKSTVEASIARMEEGLRAKTHVRTWLHACIQGSSCLCVRSRESEGK
jgi:hypothetical protein